MAEDGQDLQGGPPLLRVSLPHAAPGPPAKWGCHLTLFIQKWRLGAGVAQLQPRAWSVRVIASVGGSSGCQLGLGAHRRFKGHSDLIGGVCFLFKLLSLKSMLSSDSAQDGGGLTLSGSISRPTPSPWGLTLTRGRQEPHGPAQDPVPAGL